MSHAYRTTSKNRISYISSLCFQIAVSETQAFEVNNSKVSLNSICSLFLTECCLFFNFIRYFVSHNLKLLYKKMGVICHKQFATKYSLWYFGKKLFKMHSSEWSYFTWTDRWRWEIQQAILCIYDLPKGGHAVLKFTPRSTFISGNIIGPGRFCYSVPEISSAFIMVPSLTSWEDVGPVSLHEYDTSFWKSVQFCKTTVPFSVMTVLSHYMKVEM